MPRYLLKVDGKVSGPYGERALQEMASVRSFDETAMVAPEATETWALITQVPELHELLFRPADRHLHLKAKPFEVIEQRHPDVVSVDQILQENLAAEMRAARPPLKRYPNRRLRDFVVALVLILGALGGLWYALPHSRAVEIGLLSTAAFASAAVYWVLFHIMSRY